MFHVFCVDPQVEIPKILAKVPDASKEALRAALHACRPKDVAEYNCLDVAEDYAARLRQAGCLNVRVKIQILVGLADGKVGTQWVPAAEMDYVNATQQTRLRGIMEGGRFAPRQESWQASL